MSRKLSGFLRLFDDLRRARGGSLPGDEEASPAEPPTIDGYRITELVGEGGMGEVWKATDTALDAVVAIKFASAVDWDEHAAKRFLREARSMASVRHPNVVHIYSFGESSAGPYFVMEYVDGESLARRVEEGPMSVGEALDVLDQVVAALEAAWAKKIIHRDIKPANILLDTNGWVRVCDFGLAKPATTGTAGVTTHSERILGTPHYMSPEHAAGNTIDFRSDIYSLGIVGYEMLAGETPFAADSPLELIAQHAEDPLPRLQGEVPSGVADLIDWMTRKDPADRPQSYAALRARITALKRAGRSRVSRVALMTASAAIVFAVALAVWATWFRALPGPRTSPMFNERFATGPWSKAEPLFSPDGDWVSFISERNGSPDLWARSRSDGREQLLVDAEEPVVSHTWSDDGRRVAYLTRAVQGLSLHVAPAWSSPEASVRIDAPYDEARLVRWAGDSIYVFFPREFVLRRARLPDLELEDVIGAGFEPELRDVDVRPGEQELVFVAFENEREDLWRVDLDGGNLRQLTDDAARQYAPRWVGEAGDSILYLSDQRGQIDIWELDAEGAWRREVTSSADVEGRIDTTPDGLGVVYESASEESDIWVREAGIGGAQQYTSDSLHDLWPTLAADTVAFQRARPAVDGFALFDGRILTKQWGDAIDADERVIDEHGFAPHISPDGRWVAFFRLTSNGVAGELRVVDTASRESHRLSSALRVPGFVPFPTEWNSKTVAWSSEGSSLYFVEIDPRRQQLLKRTTLSEGQPQTTTVATGPVLPVEMVDLRPSPDGRRIAYLVVDDTEGRGEILELDIASGGTRPLLDDVDGNHLYLRGWYRDAPLVVRGTRDETGTETAEILVRDGGTWRAVGDPIDFAIGPSAAFETYHDAVVIAVSERGVRNLLAVDIATGERTRLTNNVVSNVAFASVAIGPSGRLMFVRQQQDRDLWLTTFAPLR